MIKRGIGKEDNVISGIWWIIDNGKKYNIKVVNISFGTFNKEGNNKKLIEAVELLWDMGYVIIAAKEEIMDRNMELCQFPEAVRR
ncbi:MAG: hypothetical protein ACLUR5_13775 [Eubacterium ventriosum]